MHLGESLNFLKSFASANQDGVSLRCSYEPLVGTQLAKSSQRTDRSHFIKVSCYKIATL